MGGWSIEKKLLVCTFVLGIGVAALTFSGFSGVYSYRGTVKGISSRAKELPLTTQLSHEVRNMRFPVDLKTGNHGMLPSSENYDDSIWDGPLLRQQFRDGLTGYQNILTLYQDQLAENELLAQTSSHISDNRDERKTVDDIIETLSRIQQLDDDEHWVMRESFEAGQLRVELELLQQLTNKLPNFLQERLLNFADEVRVEYRTWIVMTWLMSILTAALVILLVYFMYAWVISPLRTLVRGSRFIANGNFDHRVQLNTHDELAELGHALNDMTQRFQDIRDALDEKVKQRTKEVVRSEQMASIGFLAAGVAHEINNPLASIALCSESLEGRLHDIIQADDLRSDADHNEEISQLRNYLRMIQDEAFRCKEITEGLLDFSRLGEVSRHRTDISELTRGVVELIGHVGQYKEKQIDFRCPRPVFIPANPQELKQVLLNLVTNALDCVGPGGRVEIDVQEDQGFARIRVKDDGCGMTDEVKEHLFEPFFTRRRDGQGTGLGLSISYRIVSDHGGRIVAHSDGPGTGSEFLLLLPINPANEELNHYYQAAAA